jgi:nucleosome binding factor SPN SPT16 subunit
LGARNTRTATFSNFSAASGPSAYFGALTMTYVTRQLSKAVDKLREELRDALNQQKSAIHAAEERRHEQKEIENKYLEKILSAYQHAKGNEPPNAERNYSVQKSLRWAAWFAFGAAVIYATIAAVRWRP